MMGIRPNRDGLIPPVTPDNPETRYSDWLTDLEDSGEIVGGVWQETDAKASSGNEGVSDLAGRVAAMEAVSSTSGTGWIAKKQSDLVVLTITGAEGSFTLPAGYRPTALMYAPAFDLNTSNTGQPRISITASGVVSTVAATGKYYANTAFYTK